ncbi:TetR-like C-terminal domain-containing protein [Agromyces sp. PvR057]|uniref:TetR-like C-terminal domain-containing protein n=1 Tax=Agromyces sp. PvR057 TaxID=3156403 RepID=UPI0033970C98
MVIRRRSGVDRPTELPIPDTGDIRADLTSWLTGFARGLDEEHAATRARLLTAATAESAIVARAFEARVAGPYRLGLVQRLQRAIDSGELSPGAPVQVVADALMGATLYSVFLRSPRSEPTVLLAGVLLDGIRQVR